MPTINLNWVGVPNTNPISPPAGFTNLGAATANVASQAWSGNSSSSNAVWGCNTVPNSAQFTVSVVTADATSNGRGIAVYNSSGNGFMFLARGSDVRVFALAAYVLSGSVLATYAATIATGNTVSVEVTQATGTYVVRNQSTIIGTFVNATYTSGLRAGLLSRSGSVSSFALTYTAAQSIDTFTDPLIPNSPASGTQTGFSNGAITANFGGLLFTGSVSGAAISGTLQGFVDGDLCPLLPASSVSGTFTQGANTASITRQISSPSGLQELRDSSNNPAGFSGLVLGDPKYIGQAFLDAGNPLAAGDRSYVSPLYGMVISQDGGVSLNAPDHPTSPVPSLPYTTTLWIRRSSDGRVYSHSITIGEDGGISVSRSLSVSGLLSHGVSVHGLTVSGL